MCRYGDTTYKPHYACFECRKTFKRRLLGDIRGAAKDSVEAKCPECGNLTADMGLDFESPKNSDVKGWEGMKNLYAAGVTFHSCGCTGPGYIPSTNEKLLEFLIGKRTNYVENLRFWLNRKAPITKREFVEDYKETWHQIPYQLQNNRKAILPETAISYWNEKLAELERRIQDVNRWIKD